MRKDLKSLCELVKRIHTDRYVDIDDIGCYKLIIGDKEKGSFISVTEETATQEVIWAIKNGRETHFGDVHEHVCYWLNTDEFAWNGSKRFTSVTELLAAIDTALAQIDTPTPPEYGDDEYDDYLQD